MKSQKGITLMSLVIYVIAFMIVAGIIGSITTFFYSNYNFLDERSGVAAEFNKLNLAFAEEVKTRNNKIYSVKSNIKIDEERWSSFFDESQTNETDHPGVLDDYESKLQLLEDIDKRCGEFFNTYIIFDDENFIGWRKDDSVIYYNQSVLCKNVGEFLINKTVENEHDVLSIYVELGTKAYSSKYTF